MDSEFANNSWVPSAKMKGGGNFESRFRIGQPHLNSIIYIGDQRGSRNDDSSSLQTLNKEFYLSSNKARRRIKSDDPVAKEDATNLANDVSSNQIARISILFDPLCRICR